MLKSRNIDKICITVIILAVVLTVVFMCGERLGIKAASKTPGYAQTLFSDDVVHNINIDINEDEWNDILRDPFKKEYKRCDITIDGETVKNVGIRAKGNNSMSLISENGLNRYSLKVEFDHFDSSVNYKGLDKLALNTSFQDNSYLKEFMTYDMMKHMGIAAPLSSYSYVKVNGEDRGLFVNVEEPEESFAKRNYGKDYGQLYKPDYKDIDDPNEDLALKYLGDKHSKYDNIFRNSKFDTKKEDKDRLIGAIKTLNEDLDNIEKAVNVDDVIRYFVVQTFVVDWDSYLGHTCHNFFLHEKEGMISIIPWDYNLAHGTYITGMPDPIDDPTVLVNNPINTPNEKDVMFNRPLFHNLMLNNDYLKKYHSFYDDFLNEYIDSGYFKSKLNKTIKMITPYVKKDPTKFISYQDFILATETYEEFCMLRTESIKGQLAGTIPATIRGQKNSRDLINADHISIYDMGDMDDLML